jgi:hypothetical protein
MYTYESTEAQNTPTHTPTKTLRVYLLVRSSCRRHRSSHRRISWIWFVIFVLTKDTQQNGQKEQEELVSFLTQTYIYTYESTKAQKLTNGHMETPTHTPTYHLPRSRRRRGGHDRIGLTYTHTHTW